MSTKVVEVRSDPRTPVIAKGDITNSGNFSAVSFQHPLLDKVGSSVAILAHFEIVIASEEAVDVLMCMPAGKIREVDLLKPSFFHENGEESKMPAGFVLSEAVVSLNVQNAAKRTGNAKSGEVIENGGEGDIAVANKPVEVKQEDGVLTVLNEAPYVKVGATEVIRPAFGITKKILEESQHLGRGKSRSRGKGEK